jgi:hypothetical protein
MSCIRAPFAIILRSLSTLIYINIMPRTEHTINTSFMYYAIHM